MAKKLTEATVPGIQLEYFVLMKAEAEALRPLPNPGDEDVVGEEASLGISAARYPKDPKALRVDFEYTLSGGPIKLLLLYRMRFIQVGPEPAADEVDDFWRRMVARFAPTITMPYVREMVHSLTSRMGSVGFLVPVANYGLVFEPEAIEFGEVEPLAEENATAPSLPPKPGGGRRRRSPAAKKP